MHIVSLLGGGCGFYTKVAMRKLDERRAYYEHKRKSAIEEKTKLAKEILDSQQDDCMSLGVNDDPLEDSYIPGAY